MPMSVKTALCLLLLIGVTVLAAGFQSAKAEDVLRKPVDPLLELLDEAPQVSDQPPRPDPETLEDFANQYYFNCIERDDHLLDEESLQILCGCASAKIIEVMGLQDMKVLGDKTSEGELQRSRMLFFVYTPCFEPAIKALVHKQCINNDKVKSGLKYYKKICACSSDGMADFMRERAPDYMGGSLRRRDAHKEPLRALMESRAYEEQSRYYMNKCIQLHEYTR